MNLGKRLEELQLQHLPMRIIQPFASDLLTSQLKFPASYQKYRFISTHKGEPGAKLY